jgi:hypothetical protein
MERSVQAHQLMEEGQQLCAEENFEEGVQVLRSAYTLAEGNSIIRSRLVDSLLRQALAVLQTNLSLAESLTNEALELEPGNPVTKSVSQTLREHKQAALAKPKPAAAPKIAGDSKPPEAPQTAPQTANNSEPADKVAAQPKILVASPISYNPIASVAKPPAPAPKPVERPAANASTIGGMAAPLGHTPQAPPWPTAAPPKLPVTPAKALAPPVTAPVTAPIELPPQAPHLQVKPQLPEVPGTTVESTVSEPRTPTARVVARVATVPIQPQAPSEAKATPKPRPVAAPPAVRRRKLDVPRWAWAAGAVAVLAICGMLVKYVFYPTVAPVLVEIRTSPPGAKVSIDGEVRETAGPVALTLGIHRIEAFLEGYQAAVQDTRVDEEFRGPILLTLVPAMQTIRLSTDLESGSVLLDDQPVGQLQDGQWAINTVQPGPHVLKIRSEGSTEAVIPFLAALTGPPVLTNAISANSLQVILVSNHQTRGYVYSNVGPVPLTLDGQTVGQISKAGPLELGGFSAGTHQLVLGEGRAQRTISFDVTSAAGLFVSLSSDRNVGTLEIVANADGFQTIVNGRSTKVTQQRGRFYIYNVEAKAASVRISKNGFHSEPSEQRIVVRKGETTSVSFKLTPIPTTASLRLSGALPGTRVALDGAPQELQPDGSLIATVSEGEHTIELARPGYKPKSLRVPFKAGQTVNLSGNQVMVDAPTTGKLTVASRSPGNARVILRRDGIDTPIPGRDAEVPEGSYTLIATAPGYRDDSRSVTIAEGTSASVDVKLVSIPQIVRMEGWEDPAGWRLEDPWYTRKGGEFVLFKASANEGTIQFTARHKGRQLLVFGGGRIQWVENFVDMHNYDLYQIDKERLSWKRVVNGRPGPEQREPHRVTIKDDTYRLQLEVSSGQMTGKIFDGQTWMPLPRLGTLAPREGRFGFFLPGNEEVWISGFEFRPKE